ncbi:SMP-30/gluconolactonase/LRE family protein [Flavobacteriaceae bacterium XHP0103]|uniref:SMP-30/gluconolactonase/LRE family protein n=1 Tax=Marixanthotalea marina TaxID=2844359 RepID=UPI002989E143|nr:SMP-30/gluconolactonase/LRE family protein [Marixanthotalea marina]MBU3820674.1 SMP-30/gluconolactonase/LRE family protein [Marixanthotalea marina]
MQKSLFSLIIIAFLFNSCKQNKASKTETVESTPPKFRIEIVNDEAFKVIDPNAEIKVLASGFTWTEGPLWVEDGGFLLFSDIPNNKVYKLSGNDTVTYLQPSGSFDPEFKGLEPGSNGLLLNEQGELILLQHGERKVVKMDAPLNNPNPEYITLADNYKGKKLNSPNDAVYDSEGNLYFTDPPYGLPELMEDPTKELDFQGIYCLLTSGELILLDKSIEFPNGIGLSKDGKTLYVSQSNPLQANWYKYDVTGPGKVENKQLFYDVTSFIDKEGYPGAPDGLEVNKNDIVFASGPGGIWVFNSEGTLLAKILTGERTSNCAFGTDEKTLFITADDYILSVDLK